MRLEIVPLIIGVLIGLLGLALMFDAWTPDEIVVRRERRRQPRVERNRGGEALIGLGVIGMAAAFIGRDTWRYSVVAVIGGTVFLIWGALANRHFIGASISNRGALRRRPANVSSSTSRGVTGPADGAGIGRPPSRPPVSVTQGEPLKGGSGGDAAPGQGPGASGEANDATTVNRPKPGEPGR